MAEPALVMWCEEFSADGQKKGPPAPDNTVPDNGVAIGLSSLWEQQLLSDYIIQVQDSKFHVHKIIMASASDYFRVVLTGSERMFESQPGIASIEGVSAAVMEILLHYIYKDQLIITKDNVSEVLSGAVYLQIELAIKLCTKFIAKHLDVNNWYETLSLFRSYDLIDAVEDVKSYIAENIYVITKDLDSGQLTFEDVFFFVDKWKSCEWDLFIFVKDWIYTDFENRKEHREKLLKNIRYGLMTPAELQAIQQMDISSSQQSSWCRLVDKALTYHKLPIRKRVLDTSEQTTVRGPPTFVRFLWKPEAPTDGFFFEPHREKSFVAHKGLKTPEGSAKCLADIEINNFLVVCIQTVNKKYEKLEKWYIYDPRTMEWTRMADLPRTLSGGALVQDGTFLYAVGGEELETFHDVDHQVNRYNFNTNKWSTFSELPEQLGDFGACVLDNRLYVSGGQIEDDPCYSHTIQPEARFDCLDLTTRKWKRKPDMLKANSLHDMYAMRLFGEGVCVIFDGSFNMEYFSPSKNQWSKCTFSFLGHPFAKKCIGCYQRGNSFYLVASHVNVVFDEATRACVVVRFHEADAVATVEYKMEHKGEETKQFSNHHSALAINPQANKTKV